MPRYYCDYCDAYLTHDSASVRKQHNIGYKHKSNVKAYFLQFDEENQARLIAELNGVPMLPPPQMGMPPGMPPGTIPRPPPHMMGPGMPPHPRPPPPGMMPMPPPRTGLPPPMGMPRPMQGVVAAAPPMMHHRPPPQ